MANGFDTRRFFSYLGISLFVLLAIAVPLGLVGPTKPDTKGYDSAVSAALAAAASNNATAQGAPQQAVVNGWLARDLMEIQIKQNNDELVLLHLSVAVLIAALLAVIVAGAAAARARPGTEPADKNLWIEPPDSDDTPDDCAQWFVDRLTVALADANANRSIRLRPGDLDLLAADAGRLSEETRREVTKLASRASDALRAALERDTLDARTAGLLDAASGLPLSWIKNHEQALGSTRYPVAAQIASAVADLDPE